jgi:uncharacterized protein (UPF0548 family)
MVLTTLPPEIRDRLADLDLTYPEVSATTGDLPVGYHHIASSVLIGRGRQVFVTAADAVRGWQVQVRAGLAVSTSSPTATRGTVLMLGLGIGPLRLEAPCRVVYAVEEPQRHGFAYGTLAGHPESGEEAFIVERHDDDMVTFSVIAFSRPATRLAKIAGPLGTAAQHRITARYLRSLQR